MEQDINVNDIVTINARVIAISEAGNPIIQFPCGVKCLIKARDVISVRQCEGDTCKFFNTKKCITKPYRRPVCEYFEED